MKLFNTLLTALFVLAFCQFTFATSYTWNGSSSSAWGTAANWTPNGVPGASDNVTIVSAGTAPVYDGVAGVTNFTISSGTLDLNGYTLSISGQGYFSGGTVSNGVVNAVGATNYFLGTVFNTKVTVVSASPYLNGSTFNDSLIYEVTGSLAQNNGGNKFNGPVIFINSGNYTPYYGHLNPDTFNYNLHVYNTGNGSITLAGNSDDHYFADTIFINCTSGQGIYFGNAGVEYSQAANKPLVIGNDGFSAGILKLRNWVQQGSADFNLTLTGSASIWLEDCGFGGDVTLDVPYIDFYYSTFNGEFNLTRSGATSNSAKGGNLYNDEVTFINTGGTFTTALTYPDTFNALVTFRNEGGTFNAGYGTANNYFNGDVKVYNLSPSSGAFQFQPFGASGSTTFDGDVYVNSKSSGGVHFGPGNTPTLTMTAGHTIAVGDTGFIAGTLQMRRFEQEGTVPMSLTTTLTGNLKIVSSELGGNFTYDGSGFILDGATFNGTASFTRDTSVNQELLGTNIYYNDVLFKNNGTGHLMFRTSDTYHSDATFIATSTGYLKPGNYSTNAFKGNIHVNDPTRVTFGLDYGGSKVVLSGDDVQTISADSTGTIQFRDLQTNKSQGYASFKRNISIMDSLILTDGIIYMDTFLLEIKDNAKAVGASDTSYVNGKVKKRGNDAFTYPVGKNGHYRPIGISAPANTTAEFVAEYFGENSDWIYPHDNKDVTIDEISWNEYWGLERTSSTNTVSITLYWDTTTSCAFDSIDSLRVVSWDGSQWKDLGNGGTTGDTISGSIVSSSVSTHYAAFALGITDTMECDCDNMSVDAGDFQMIPRGDTTELGAVTNNPSFDYVWTPNQWISDTNAFMPNTYPEGYIEYFVTAQFKQCSVTDSVIVGIFDTTFTINDTVGYCSHDPALRKAMLSDTSYAATYRGGGGSFSCGDRFELIFQDVNTGIGKGFDEGGGIGATRRNTACAVFEYIESVFDIPPGPDPIQIVFQQSWHIPNNPPPPYPGGGTILGVSSFTSNPSSPPGFYGGYMYDHITTGIDPDGGTEDAFIQLNFWAVPWHDDYQTPVPECEFDLFSVILHEVVHSMGISSRVTEDGNTQLPVCDNNEQHFSLWDREFLYYGDIFNDIPPYQKLVNNLTLQPLQITDCVRDGKIWVHDGASDFYHNDPIISSLPSSPYQAGFIGATSLSHYQGHLSSFYHRGSVASGFIPEYVMNPFAEVGHSTRELTLQEIRDLAHLGYTVNSSIPVNNSPPYHTHQLFPNQGIFPVGWEENIPADFTIANDGQPLVIDLSADSRLVDDENDDIIVYPGSLYNIRGCGNGGNNHSQLTISQDGTQITYSPRADFIGRAQFAFNLGDEHEKGAIMVYTIDVTPGSNFNNGNELIINGDFEEGMEVVTINDQTGHAENSNTFGAITFGTYGLGNHFVDGHVNSIVNVNRAGLQQGAVIRESDKHGCLNGGPISEHFGHPALSFPGNGFSIIDNHPEASQSQGNRYLELQTLHVFFRLAEALEQCKRYRLEFDINFEHQQYPILSDPYDFEFAITTATGFPTVSSNQNEHISIDVQSGWQHETYDFTYCSINDGNFINIIPHPIGNQVPEIFYIDNISLVEITPDPMTVDAGEDELICYGSSTQLDATITSDHACTPQIVWSPSTGLSDPNIANPIANPTSTTEYTVTVTDACSTSVNDAVIVTVNPELLLSSSSEGVNCNGDSNGEATATPSGGTAPYSYAWSNGGSNATITGLSGGGYNVTVTDANGCTITDGVTVTEPSAIDPGASVVSHESCIGLTDGEATSSPSGGTAPYSYAWSNGGSNATITGLSADTYTVTITDDNGCSETEEVIINSTSPPTVDISGSATSCGSPHTYSVASAGMGATYAWSTTEGTIQGSPPYSNSISIDFGSSYFTSATVTVTVTLNGCEATDNFEVEGCCVVPSVDMVDDPTFNLNDDYLDVTNTLVPVTAGVCNTQTFHLNGTLTVNSDLEFYQCEIYMSPGASIVINGATLTLDGTYIHAACDELWDEILVNGSGAEIILENATVIEDAEIGVHCLNAGEFTMSNSTFNKNFKHVLIENSGSYHVPGGITNCNFYCQVSTTNSTPASILPPIGGPTYVGVEVVGNLSATITSNPDISPAPQNDFSNSLFGIYAHDGQQTLIVTGNDFSGHITCMMVERIAPEGDFGFDNNTVDNVGPLLGSGGNGLNVRNNLNFDIKIRNNTFTDVDRWAMDLFNNGKSYAEIENNNISQNQSPLVMEASGIRIEETFLNSGLDIECETNTMTDVRFGIRGLNLRLAEFINNDISIVDYPLNSNFDEATGIRLDNCFSPFLINNEVTGHGDYPWTHLGIRLDACNGALLRCNTTNDISRGFVNSGMTPLAVYMRGQMNGDHLDGFMQNAGIINATWINFNNDNYTWDNQWIGTFADHHLFCYDCPSATLYKIRHPQNDSWVTSLPGLHPSNILSQGHPNILNFMDLDPVDNSSNQPVDCGTVIDDPEWMRYDIPFVKQFIGDSLNFAKDSIAHRWWGRYGIYHSLGIDTLHHADTAFEADIILDTLFLEDTTLLNFKAAFELDATGKLDSIARRFNTDLDATTAANLRAQNAKVVTTNTLDSLWKDILDIAFLKTAVGDTSYTSGQIDRLEYAASSCPFTEGVAVYMARGILRGVSDSTYWNICEILPDTAGDPPSLRLPGSDPIAPSYVGNEYFKVYPNPARDVLVIDYALEMEEELQFIMYDITGRKAKEITLTGKENKYTLPLNEAESGVYLYRAVTPYRQVDSGKIIILK